MEDLNYVVFEVKDFWNSWVKKDGDSTNLI